MPDDEINVLRMSIIYVVRVRERQTPPSCCTAKPQPIRDFPTIECRMFYCLLSETPINRHVHALQVSLEVAQLACTSGPTQSVAL